MAGYRWLQISNNLWCTVAMTGDFDHEDALDGVRTKLASPDDIYDEAGGNQILMLSLLLACTHPCGKR